ncbi:MAG: AAA family ATPase [Okeania sp. SIO3C4]|nr:AAA family ATPase [Okeania sp. SIO3C4]
MTGENGFGKTSILKAILSGLTGYNNKLSENTRVEINALCKQLPRVHYSDIVKRNILNGNFHFYEEIYAPLASFGATRTKFWTQTAELSNHANLSGENEFVLDIENKLKVLHGVERLSSLKEKIIETLKDLVPRLADIRIVENKSKNDTEILYIEKDDQYKELSPVKFNDLALGMRSIIGMVGEIIIRLLGEKTYADSNDNKKYKLVAEPVGSPTKHISSFSELSGIVLIDEFDNHLHPKWQRRLVEKLTELFPRVQFIVSTHSPIPLLGAPENSVVLKVNRTKAEGITVEKIDVDLSELPPENILSSPIFDFQDIIPKQYQRNKRLRTEKGYDEAEFYKILEEKVQNMAKEAGVEYKKGKKE